MTGSFVFECGTDHRRRGNLQLFVLKFSKFELFRMFPLYQSKFYNAQFAVFSVLKGRNEYTYVHIYYSMPRTQRVQLNGPCIELGAREGLLDGEHGKCWIECGVAVVDPLKRQGKQMDRFC